MRALPWHNAERFRLPPLPGIKTHVAGDPFGAFAIPYQNFTLRCLVSSGYGWEHVSVSLSNRCPNWHEMMRVKETFWEDEEVCFQLAPAKSQWVNVHPHTLHWWRPVTGIFPQPYRWMVGPYPGWEKEARRDVAHYEKHGPA